MVMPQAPWIVCIVEDDDAVRKSLSRLMRASGFQVRTFATPESFLEVARPEEHTCVLMDITMPRMSGLQLQKRLREKGVDLPVIAVSGRDDDAARETARSLGARFLLSKPVDDELLLRTVNDEIMLHATAQARHGERQEFMARLSLLSSREREVMEHVIRGRLNKQIAADLDISLKTVKVHRGRMMSKLTCRSVAALVHACQLAGIHPQTQVAP